MTDPTNDLSSEERHVRDLLLRSARLDVAEGNVKQRALEAGLAVFDRKRRSRPLLASAGVGLALAALAVLWFARSAGPENVPGVVPERLPAVAPARTPPVDPRPPCPKLVIARGDAELIEDWEAHDSRIAPLDGRGGNWATYDDGTGKQTPPDKSPLFPNRLAPARGASTRGLHVFGGKFKDWGVTFGAELADAACYDASAYAGFSFFAKGPGVVRVGFQMLEVQDVRYGGLCKTDCYNAHRTVVELSKDWKQYSVRWEELRQLYQAGPPLAFDPSRVRFLEFSIVPEDTPFDLWIDDVSFLRR